MTTYPPPAISRMPLVAFGVSAACLGYAGSLAFQRVFPGVADLLSLPLGNGVQPTYYLRVAASLLLGTVAAAGARGRMIAEARLAWGTAVAVLLSVALVCLFP